MNKFYHFLFLLPILLFFGCVPLSTQQTKSIVLLVKSGNFRFYDSGFIHYHKNSINLQIYNSGKNILNLRIRDKICLNSICQSRTEFNEKFFLTPHYPELLDDILMQRPIYFQKDLVKTECGFEQNISNVSVEYSVCNGKMSFIDAKNGIKIIMKETN